MRTDHLTLFGWLAVSTMPFGLVEAVWSGVAVRRWWREHYPSKECAI